MCWFLRFYSPWDVHTGVKGDIISHSRDKHLLLKPSLLLSLTSPPQLLALHFLRDAWLKATDDDIRWSPSCMPWCHYSGGESFQSDMAACREPSRFYLKRTCTLRTFINKCVSASSSLQKTNIPKGHPVAFYFFLFLFPFHSLSRLLFSAHPTLS